MSVQEDVTFRVRPVKDAPTSHPWLWLAAIIGTVIICFAAVAIAGTPINSGLYG